MALETAVVTHGLPRTAHPEGWPGDAAEGPLNLGLARALSASVRAGGATPAVTAIVEGTLHIGLGDEALADLAARPNVAKATSGNLAALMAHGATAGTTVAGTLEACRMATAGGVPIRVFATGGIGGVHAGWQTRPDVSADLAALAATPVCVVCAGAKSILDGPATLEALEALAVPVIGWQTDCFPRFHALGDEPLALRSDTADEVAAICRTRWETLAQRGAVLLTQPITPEEALDPAWLDAHIESAEREADAAGIAGAARTPFVLDELARRTDGRSLRANVALLLANARLAAEIACALDSHAAP